MCAPVHPSVLHREQTEFSTTWVTCASIHDARLGTTLSIVCLESSVQMSEDIGAEEARAPGPPSPPLPTSKRPVDARGAFWKRPAVRVRRLRLPGHPHRGGVVASSRTLGPSGEGGCHMASNCFAGNPPFRQVEDTVAASCSSKVARGRRRCDLFWVVQVYAFTATMALVVFVPVSNHLHTLSRPNSQDSYSA